MHTCSVHGNRSGGVVRRGVAPPGVASFRDRCSGFAATTIPNSSVAGPQALAPPLAQVRPERLRVHEYESCDGLKSMPFRLW